MNRQLDVLFIAADSSVKAYQELSEHVSAIEPPTWALLLAQACRSNGFGVAILDCCAEHLSREAATIRVAELKPRLACFVMYGQNPNSGTTNMIGTLPLAESIKEYSPEIKICFVGSHVSALPKEVLAHWYVDFVLLNEGVYALQNLLRTNLEDYVDSVKGIGYKRNPSIGFLTEPEQVVPSNLMDVDLPGYAWDLLPYRSKPLDLYRCHFWHGGFDHTKRSPFAAIYTSLGCRFKCDFCMINIVNRVNNGEHIASADSPNYRTWSPEFALRQFDILVELGIKNIRISDEMFFLDARHFEPILNGLAERGYGLNSWAYTRVDTVREKYLEQFMKAGIGWFGIGIETANQKVRREVTKGTFNEIDIREIFKVMRGHGLKFIANYIFGLPDDNYESMQETLNLACELNTEVANMYPCQALPGSPLYWKAKQLGWKLPSTPNGFAFLSYECEPLPTKHLTSAQVLKFRDDAFHSYHNRPEYLALVETTFGSQQRKNVEDMLKIRLKRKILGD